MVHFLMTVRFSLVGIVVMPNDFAGLVVDDFVPVPGLGVGDHLVFVRSGEQVLGDIAAGLVSKGRVRDGV